MYKKREKLKIERENREKKVIHTEPVRKEQGRRRKKVACKGKNVRQRRWKERWEQILRGG